MSGELQHFQTLKEQFPSWDDLKEHLTSERGGSLRIVVPPSGGGNHPELVVIRLKGATSAPGAGLFRSVVWDTAANRPVCVAPPKAQEGAAPAGRRFSSVEEFVDGFMVNAFVLRSDPAVLQIATRTQLGGDNTFYSAKSFRTLFEEAVAATPVRTLAALTMQLRERLDAEQGAVSVFASFVVQHSEHRIVAKVVSPDVSLVQLGVCREDGGVQLFGAPAEWPAGLRRLAVQRYPVREFQTDAEVADFVRRTAVQNGWRWQGLVFKDGPLNRWRMRSPTYSKLRGLRGAEARPVDRFLRLRRAGSVLEYLKHYGEERALFWNLEQTLRARTADVFAAYSAVHKAHALTFAELPAAYKTPVHHMHVEYLATLRPAGQTVLLKHAITAVNGLKDFEQRRLLDAGEWAAPTNTPAEAPEPVSEMQAMMDELSSVE